MKDITGNELSEGDIVAFPSNRPSPQLTTAKVVGFSKNKAGDWDWVHLERASGSREFRKSKNKVVKIYKQTKPDVSTLLDSIRISESQLKEIRDECEHENFESNNLSNTGNYDPSCDSYWVDVKCLDCGKTMSFDYDNDKEDYRKFSA